MDGLLVDSERILMEACIEAAAEIGITYTKAEYTQLIGNAWAVSTQLMIGQLGSEENFNHVMTSLNRIMSTRDHHFPLQDGVVEILEHYKAQGVVCAVASSSPVGHINDRLSTVGVLDYFSAVASGHEVENGKPAPDVYLLAMERLQQFSAFGAHECIAFEDSDPGATAAMAAGLRTIVVPDLKAPSDDVRENCFKVCDSLHTFLATHADL